LLRSTNSQVPDKTTRDPLKRLSDPFDLGQERGRRAADEPIREVDPGDDHDKRNRRRRTLLPAAMKKGPYPRLEPASDLRRS
jgi:hypothetical protein